MDVRLRWVLLGDFNCVMHKEERTGAAISDNEMMPFSVARYGIDYLKSSNNYYTWNNK